MDTDREVLLAMFERAGIVWEDDNHAPHIDAISVTKGDGPHNIGYGGFAAVFVFNPDGSLKEVGAFE